jgi:hypothetical protein
MVDGVGVGLSVLMTRRLESVLLITALIALSCLLALTSVTAGITAFLR